MKEGERYLINTFIIEIEAQGLKVGEKNIRIAIRELVEENKIKERLPIKEEKLNGVKINGRSKIYYIGKNDDFQGSF